MVEWDYWTVTIQETPQREEVMKQALAEGGKYGFELVAVTPIVSSLFAEKTFAIGGTGGWSTQTMALILTFKKPRTAAPPSTT